MEGSKRPYPLLTISKGSLEYIICWEFLPTSKHKIFSTNEYVTRSDRKVNKATLRSTKLQFKSPNLLECGYKYSLERLQEPLLDTRYISLLNVIL